MQTIEIPTSTFGQVLLDTPLADLEEELRHVERAMRKLENHATILRLGIQIKKERGDEEALGPKAVVAAPERPSLSEAITWILNERGQTRLSELYAALEARGWLPSGPNARSQLSARLSKLVDQRRVVRTAPATYALLTDTDEPGGPPD